VISAHLRLKVCKFQGGVVVFDGIGGDW